jgi:HAE1 family hydrophobic/amphiphilic exporter-1
METQLAAMTVPEGYAVSLRGQYTELAETLPEMIFTIALAIVLVYMVLASQFQSFSLPLIIMCSIPLTLTGSSGALMITGQSLNINSGIGMVLLVGTVVNNAIVLVDRVLASRAAGLGAREALIEAGTRRVRPIIMTTATTVFAMIPVALGIGSGAEIQRPLAVTVTGGLLVSTALTLVVIPALYAIVYPAGDTRRSGERR